MLFCEVAGREEMQEIDRYSIEEIGIPSMVLMERAALCVADEICAREGKKIRVLCVCGMGNNGGDGIAVARILRERGIETGILMVGVAEKQSRQCREQLEIARNISIPVHFFSSDRGKQGTETDFGAYTVIVDAIFGIGLKREISGVFAQVIEKIHAFSGKIYAVDIPSGVDAETGQVLGSAVRADVTVTFGVQKKGLLLPPGYLMAGTVLVKDIGFPKEAVGRMAFRTFYCPDVADSFEKRRGCLKTLLPSRRSESNKGSYGKVLVVAGCSGMAGAAVLCAEAAYRMGCGLVKVFSEKSNRLIIQTRLPEAIFSGYSMEEPEEAVCGRLKEALDWASVVVFGPGVGISGFSGRLLKTVMDRDRNLPLVLDADGLNLLAGLPDTGKFEKLGSRTVCTPHMKEMERLCGGSATVDMLKAERMTAIQKLPGFSGILVLKDARTVVQSRTSAWINTHGTNGMATGGSGDVLAGIIGGVLAAGGIAEFEGAVHGVAVHALLGELAAERWTPNGMLAGSLLSALEGKYEEDIQ